MSAPPAFSVVLPVFDGARWLRGCVESVLAQSETSLELIAVDDGSTDETGSILDALARRDARIRVLHRPHRGLVASLNEGLDAARGDWVARIDADDTWAPGRLAAQRAFVERSPEVGLLGTAVRHVDVDGGAIREVRRPETDLEIRWKALLWCPFTHSSILVRRSILEARGLRYDPACELAEDYDLWLRLLEVTRAANLPEPLVEKRRHESYSVRNREAAQARAVAIAGRAIAREAPGFDAAPEEIGALRRAFAGVGNAHLPAGRPGYALAERYLDLLDAFAAARPPGTDPGPLRAAEGARLLRALPVRPASLPLHRLLARIERLAPGSRRRFWSPARRLGREGARARRWVARAGWIGR